MAYMPGHDWIGLDATMRPSLAGGLTVLLQSIHVSLLVAVHLEIASASSPMPSYRSVNLVTYSPKK